MKLTGNDIQPAMPMTDSEINHLRRLLAWIRVEYTLDPASQRGVVLGIERAVACDLLNNTRALATLEQSAASFQRCPAYVRQAVKMLTKAVRAHDDTSKIIPSPLPPHEARR